MSARRSTQVVYVVRSGPKIGQPDLQAAFRTKSDAVRFLERVHGLTVDESRKLARQSSLDLDRNWHGSDRCEIGAEIMDPEQAATALSGDLYLAA